MSTIQTSAPPRRRRWLRWLMGGVAAVLVVGGLFYAYLEMTRDRDLLEAIAEADRLDPGWRFAEIEAARAAVPDAENGALLVQRAFAGLPPNWLAPAVGDGPDLEQRLENVPLPQRPAEVDLEELRGELAKAAAALATARTVADRPHGRYKVAWSKDLIGTLVPHLEKLRAVGRLLILDSLLRSADGDADGAVQSCRAALSAGRSVGDEPMWGSQMWRQTSSMLVVEALEGVLARGVASPEALAAMQRPLTTEAAEPALLIAARAIRADYFQALDMMREGTFDRPAYKLRTSWLGERGDAWFDANRAAAAQAAYLRYWNAYVEIVKRPSAEQEALLQELQLPTEELPVVIAALSPPSDDWVRRARYFHAAQTRLLCAAAALAAERYRLAEHRWPDRLEALVPAYLGAVPRDPFDGEPLRLRHLPDGLMIYSVGPDRLDNGDRRERQPPDGTSADIGFRLWDPAHRGLPLADEDDR